ncbi:Maf family protein [Virgibacillus byunsanensis]|uniref:dTTP/UTP pyrophosphatase n=1 Tax=Virgibacillus byunsanensis TaxID=570945 RepID=A0ABW3LIK5_9BACI
MSHQLILASSSPRRQALLRQVNMNFTVRKQDTDESIVKASDPREKVEQLALLKARNTEIMDKGEVIVTADTVVSYQNQIFGKPEDDKDAYTMLSTLSGQVHEVYTGVAIRANAEEIFFTEKTSVEFWTLSDEDIMSYISTRDPFDKAGGYGIQSEGAVLVRSIHGDYYNVVGLPISRVVRELRGVIG